MLLCKRGISQNRELRLCKVSCFQTTATSRSVCLYISELLHWHIIKVAVKTDTRVHCSTQLWWPRRKASGYKTVHDRLGCHKCYGVPPDDVISNLARGAQSIKAPYQWMLIKLFDCRSGLPQNLFSLDIDKISNRGSTKFECHFLLF